MLEGRDQQQSLDGLVDADQIALQQAQSAYIAKLKFVIAIRYWTLNGAVTMLVRLRHRRSRAHDQNRSCHDRGRTSPGRGCKARLALG